MTGWPPETPWPVVPLRRIFRVINGGTPTGEPRYWDGGVCWITPEDLGQLDRGTITSSRRTVTDEAVRESSASLVPRESLILSTRAPIGYIARTNVATTFNQGCRALVPTIEVDPRFFLYQLNAARPVLAQFGRGSTFNELSASDLADFPVVHPPLEEQHRISDLLDAEQARVGKLDDYLQREVELATERFDAYATALIAGTRGDVSDPLAHLPADRMAVRLKHLISEPLAYGANEPGDTGRDEWPRYIRITDLTSAGELRRDMFASLPPETARPYLLHSGDILLARSGATVGKAVLYREEWGRCCYAGYLIRARPDPSMVVPEYLAYFTKTRAYWAQIHKDYTQATIQNVSAARYANLRVPLPDLGTQRAVVEALDERHEALGRLREAVGRQRTFLEERGKALIIGGMTGEVDVNGAAA